MATELFHFEQAGKKYTIPKFSNISAGTLRKSRHESDDLGRAFVVLEITLGEDSKELAAVDAMSIEGFNTFIKSWTDNGSGVALGESSGS